VAGRQTAVFEHFLYRQGEGEQAERIGDMGPRLADDLGHVFLRAAEVVDHALIATRLFDRGQILALQVLDQRHFERVAVGELAHQRRDLMELRLLRRAPAPLAGDELVHAGLARDRSYQYRL
jgi:hypothetical protein